MELKDLVGEHYLTGVESHVSKVNMWDEDAECLTFILDGVAYTAMEDPEDGYRSCLGDIIEEPDTSIVKNRFAPIRVVAIMSDESDAEVLQLIEIESGSIILEVGTRNTSDYYPWFVADFFPDRLACNQKVS